MDEPRDLAAVLAHVLWIGGGTDAGKTTVADRLAEQYRLPVYHHDPHEHVHYAQVDASRFPHTAAFAAMTMDERWVLRTPEAMAAATLATAKEHLAWTIEDLLALHTTPRVLVEGAWYFPELVAPLLSSPRRAIWLVPTEAFKWASAARRNKPSVRAHVSDPERATRNWFGRDMLLAAHARREAERRGLTVIDIDGQRSVEELTAVVAAHFAPFLS